MIQRFWSASRRSKRPLIGLAGVAIGHLPSLCWLRGRSPIWEPWGRCPGGARRPGWSLARTCGGSDAGLSGRRASRTVVAALERSSDARLRPSVAAAVARRRVHRRRAPSPSGTAPPRAYRVVLAPEGVAQAAIDYTKLSLRRVCLWLGAGSTGDAGASESGSPAARCWRPAGWVR